MNLAPQHRRLVIVSGTAHWSSRKLAEHHVAKRLTDYAEVLFVDPPISRMTALRRPELSVTLDAERLREVSPGLHLLTPVVMPGKDRAGIVRITDGQVRGAIRRAVRRLHGEVHATILTLPQRYLFGRRIPGRRIYWAKDDHQAGAYLYGLDPDRLGRTETRLAATADSFLVCSDGLARTWRERGIEPILLPNGCDAAHFATSKGQPWPDDLDPVRRYVTYVGTLTDRVDAEALRAVAERGIDVLLVGAQRRTHAWPELEALAAHPRIHHVGRRSYDQLPGYLGASAIGLLPYRLDRYNAGSFPLKLLEYLAAGLPVVSTDLPAVRWLDPPNVRIAADTSTFADAVEQELALPVDPGRSERSRAFAADHDWSQRAAQLADLLELTPKADAASKDLP